MQICEQFNIVTLTNVLTMQQQKSTYKIACLIHNYKWIYPPFVPEADIF